VGRGRERERAPNYHSAALYVRQLMVEGGVDLGFGSFAECATVALVFLCVHKNPSVISHKPQLPL
jgi:hypothetical protein